MERTLEAGIPLDVQWNDIDYMNDRNGFTLDEKNYGTLPQFVEELHKVNYL
jgi:lysosomal alpha-glucosidase